MDNIVKLCNYIENPGILFDPTPTYSGEWSFIDMSSAGIMTDILSMNAKIVNGKNLYKQFIQDTYYKNMIEILGSKNLTVNFPPVISSLPDLSGHGRSFYYSIAPFFGAFQQEGLDPSLYINSVNENASNETLLSSLRDDLRNKRKKYYDVKEQKEKSSYYEEVQSEYKGYSQTVSLEGFIDARISAFTSVIYGIRYMPDFFAKPINIDELASCFDLDKLYLCAAKSAVETSKISEVSLKALSNTIMLAVKYNETLENVKKIDPNYTCEIQWPISMPDGTVVYKPYSTKDFIKDYNEILSRHPEFKCYKIPAPSGIGEELYKDQNFMEKFARSLSAAFESKELNTSWEIIRKGHLSAGEPAPNEDEPKSISETPIAIDKEALTIEDRRRLLVQRKSFCDSTPYTYTIRGLNSFEGYIGYIYKNGNVVFEKFYKNTTTYEPAENEATYVMRFDKFVELSRLSKTEIKEYIKNMGREDVTRIYHTKNWKDKVSRTIKGMDYSEEVMAYIQQLLNSETISKVEGEKVHD